mgnify:CR=1 FL=1
MGAGHQAFYLVKMCFLGHRYHGWQKQPYLKTIHASIDKTLKYVLGEGVVSKTLGASRTDAKVSAHDAAFELFLSEAIQDEAQFIELFNTNLPDDMRCNSITPVDSSFNIIQDSKLKSYRYYFAFGEKSHPFCAPFITTILEPLDLESMKRGAKLFKGTHNFRSYCYKPKPDAQYERTITNCRIVRNQKLKANFFPKNTFVLEVDGQGFLRHQVRLMMGALIRLGKGERTLEDIGASLRHDYPYNETYVAPAAGLILESITF